MKLFLPVAGLIGCFATLSCAAPLFTIVFDEYGNGYYTQGGGPHIAMAASVAVEPHSGILTLDYQLPVPAQQGDVVLTDAGIPGDLLRFLGTTDLFVFSLNDDVDTPPAIADTAATLDPPPGGFLANPTFLPETGVEGRDGLSGYSPTGTQPGTMAGGAVFNFTSDGVVPEPATLTLASLGLALLGWKARRR